MKTYWIAVISLLLGACATLPAPVITAAIAADAVTPTATQKIDCIDGCTVTTDAYPYASAPNELPTSCRVKNNGVLMKEFAPLNGNKCETRMAFPAGTYNLTMTALDSAGKETAPSNPFAFESRRALPSPANVRVAP